MSTHPIARAITKHIREGATTVRRNGDFVEAEYPENRIAACMIMGDSVDQKDLTACVDSLKKAGIDKLFIAFNGKTRRAHQWLWNHLGEIQLPFVVQKFGWEDDFSKARNQSFGMVPKNEFDWMMWIDSDDEIVVEGDIREMLASLDEYTQGVYLRYDYAYDSESGNVSVVQWRERIVTTKIDWQWIYPIHEVLFSPANTQFAKRESVYIRHNRKTDARDDAARTRNRKIIARALKENPDHPRLQFYFANEVMAEVEDADDFSERYRLAEAAILAYKRFLSNETAQREDLYFAATRLGDLYIVQEKPNEAADAYINSIKIIPDWPDAYIGLAVASMNLEDWPRTKSFCDLALSIPTPTTPAALTPLTHQYTPLFVKGVAEEEMGNFEAAKQNFLAAKEHFNPPNGMLDERIKEVERKLAVTAKDMGLRKTLRGQRPEKSIAFVTAPLIEPWHTALEKEHGAGGAETAIMRLAPRFAADGWRTVVFGTPGAEHRGVDEDGVEWWNSNEFLPNEEFKVIVASRVPEVFEAQVNAQHKILWMHDVNIGPRLYPFVDRIDKVVGLTNWHVNHMRKLYDLEWSKMAIIPNGIELELFDLDKRPDFDGELRFIWSSSPDRGLGTLIALWPLIQSLYPESRLDIFYGWNIINKILRRGQNPYLAGLKKNILGNIDTLGGEAANIYQHGRVPQHELAEWQLKAHIWPYPTEFMETFCITAVEMQAAGVIPVASDLAALQEVVANKELLVKGWPLNTDYQKRWIKTLRETVEGNQQDALQASGRAFAEQITWDHAFTQWSDLFLRMNNQ